MWITDIKIALEMLSDYELICCVDSIKDGIITFTDGSKFSISELVKEYMKDNQRAKARLFFFRCYTSKIK